jgi:hypothetical protein
VTHRPSRSSAIASGLKTQRVIRIRTDAVERLAIEPSVDMLPWALSHGRAKLRNLTRGVFPYCETTMWATTFLLGGSQ